jgi:prevent-host-death family protein
MVIPMADPIREIPAGVFKIHCLRIMDEVAQTRTSVIVTKRGKPVAKLVPVDDKRVDPFGCMAGTGEIVGDIVNPIENLGWTGDAENI